MYTDKMINQMNKGKKRLSNFEVGDLVRIPVPKIDRSGVDRPTLPCKIIKKTDKEQYQLGCKFGIIEVYYSSGELEPLGAMAYPELNEIPSRSLSLHEAARLQSIGLESLVSNPICNCKTSCNNNYCKCKKAGEKCTGRCHNGRPCSNKNKD
jgi:hypothetical protein